MMNEKRLAIVREAESWLRTPFHHGARVKGAGVDCGQFLIAVYSSCGWIPDIQPDYYPADFHLHNSEEWYLNLMREFSDEVEAPLPGDAVLYKMGRVYSHGAVVVDWPNIIHAYIPAHSVQRAFGDNGRLAGREHKFFRARGIDD